MSKEELQKLKLADLKKLAEERQIKVSGLKKEEIVSLLCEEEIKEEDEKAEGEENSEVRFIEKYQSSVICFLNDFLYSYSLFSQTAMQSSFSINMLALVNNQTQPKILSLRHILDEYLSFQEDIIVRRTRYDLRKAEERAHLLC